MPKIVIADKLLFEVEDVLGRKIRTTKSYWRKIKKIKHPELRAGTSEVKIALTAPDEIHEDVSDSTILLYALKQNNYVILIAVKILNGDGFLVTVYQTKKYKPKGKLIWQKEKT